MKLYRNFKSSAIWVLVCLTFFSSAALSSQQSKAEAIFFEISFGDQRSFYLLEKKANSYEATLDIGGSTSKAAELSQKNWDFIVTEVNSIQKLGSQAADCPRSMMQVSIKSQQGVSSTVSCIGSKSKLGQKMTKLANLLLVLF